MSENYPEVEYAAEARGAVWGYYEDEEPNPYAGTYSEE